MFIFQKRLKVEDPTLKKLLVLIDSINVIKTFISDINLHYTPVLDI